MDVFNGRPEEFIPVQSTEDGILSFIDARR